ncbi:MAG: HIT domain-containing protein, partial [Oxalobacteraceae bacterium]
MTRLAGCELCELAVSRVVENDKFAVILADEANYPGFARVIWKDHVREVSDLPDEDRLLLNEAVWQLECAVREVMQPLKVNVASLGNVVPHLHWHVIP